MSALIRRGLVLIACSALVLMAGCGSSSKSASATTATAAGTPSTRASTTTSNSEGGLKATTTPKFATPEPSEPVHSGVVQVAYRNIAIDPDTLRVKVGSTIKWTNYDAVEHNVTSEGGPQRFASKGFGEGGSFELKVTVPGIIHYVSTTQPVTMNGTIEVVK